MPTTIKSRKSRRRRQRSVKRRSQKTKKSVGIKRGGCWLGDVLWGNEQLQQNRRNMKINEENLIKELVYIMQQNCPFADYDKYKKLLRGLVVFLGWPDTNKKVCQEDTEVLQHNMLEIIRYFKTTKIQDKKLQKIWKDFFEENQNN
jgi:RIO-like serine/threonine protein kinase